MAKKNSFIFYYEWANVLQKLPAEDVKSVVLALVKYSKEGELSALSPVADIAFTAFQQRIDNDSEKWESVCKSRSENGKRGGRPSDKDKDGSSENQTKAKKANGFSENQTKAKKAEYDYDYDYDCDNDCDNDYDYDYDYDYDFPPPYPPQRGENADEFQNQDRGESLKVETAGGNTNHSTTLDDDFDTFWKAYPKKADKQKALKAWQKLKPDKEMLNAMLAAIERHKQSDKQWHRDDGQYIPYPASWLNGRRWEDEDGVDLTAESPKDKPSYDLDKFIKHAKDNILKIDADGHTYTVPRNETE